MPVITIVVIIILIKLSLFSIIFIKMAVTVVHQRDDASVETLEASTVVLRKN